MKSNARPRPSCPLVAAIAALALMVQSPLAGAQNGAAAPDRKDPRTITLLAVKSSDAAGLVESLTQLYRRRSGVSVSVVARGAGEISRLAVAGKGDAVLMDDYEGESRLVSAKAVVERRDLMYLEMIMVGPGSDPAGIKGMTSIIDAFRLIAASKSRFISRGDDSGVNRAEKRFWKEAGVAPNPDTHKWYTILGADMRTTLGLAAATKGYTLTDTATWLRFDDRASLVTVVDDDPRMQLRFGISMVNPANHPSVKRRQTLAFIRWLTARNGGQKTIAKFEIGGKFPFSPHTGLRTE